MRTTADIVNPKPAMCWVMIDENPVSINDGSFVCDLAPENANVWVDWPATTIWLAIRPPVWSLPMAMLSSKNGAIRLSCNRAVSLIAPSRFRPRT
jgi:hypothetical protein